MSAIKAQDVIGIVTGTRIHWTDESADAAELWRKIVAVIEAGDALAFQYKGMLQWMTDTDNECDDHDKLVDVYKAYRKAKGELEAK